jgi:hypothetical protein
MSRIRIADSIRLRGLHLVARAALRLASPPRAIRLVRNAAWISRPLGDLAQARAAEDVLRGSGSCLTRSVTIAARLSGSEVVIGADRWSSRSALDAHAWVELDGERLDPARGREFVFGEIARLAVSQETRGRR